jgi:iron complex transport system permease protein
VSESRSSEPVLSAGRWPQTLALLALALAVIVLSLFVGSAEITVRQALDALRGGSDVAARSVMLELRLPRMLAAFGVGSLLALAGVLLQALFRNPLADPYVLGVSGGAAVGALLAMVTGVSIGLVQSTAVAGALIAVLAVYVLGRGGGSARLLLTGVVLASICGSLVSVLLAAADTTHVRGMVFWLAGDLSWVGSPVLSVVVALVAAAAAVMLARPLNVLASGEIRARSVGLDFGIWRAIVYLAAASLTAIAVVSAGTIGFVGLITPHSVRLIFRTSDHRIVAPAAALLGGTLLAAADLVARTAASPRQLPVGAVTALVGAPVFIALLRSRATRHP